MIKDGENIIYYSNGQISYKSNFKNGKREGEFIAYHENGQISYKTFFI